MPARIDHVLPSLIRSATASSTLPSRKPRKFNLNRPRVGVTNSVHLVPHLTRCVYLKPHSAAQCKVPTAFVNVPTVVCSSLKVDKHQCQLGGLSPRRCVLTLRDTWQAGSGLHDMASFSTEEVVVHIPPMDTGASLMRLAAAPLASKTSDARLYTFILFPKTWQGRPDIPPSRHMLVRPGLVRLIANILNNSDAKVRVVGLEDADPFSAGWRKHATHACDGIRTFRNDLQKQLRCKGHQDAAVEGSDVVRFETFVEYLNGCSWAEELPWQLVGRWLNACDRWESSLVQK